MSNHVSDRSQSSAERKYNGVHGMSRECCVFDTYYMYLNRFRKNGSTKRQHKMYQTYVVWFFFVTTL